MADKKFDGFTHKPILSGTDYLVGYIPTDNIRFQVSDLETYFNGVYTLSGILANGNLTNEIAIQSNNLLSELDLLDTNAMLGYTGSGNDHYINFSPSGVDLHSNLIVTTTAPQVNTFGNIYYLSALSTVSFEGNDGYFNISATDSGQTSNILTQGIGIDFNSTGYIKLNSAVVNYGHAATQHFFLGTDLKYNGLNVATENYVDNLISGLKFKQDVLVASTANVNISAAPSSIDGVTLSNPGVDRVLLKNQTIASQNGVYVWMGFGMALVRASDSNSNTELISATYPVRSGTVNQDTWYTVTNDTITIGTTNISFSQVAGAGTYTVGSYLKLTGNVFDIDFTNFDTDEITEGTTNLYYTDSRARTAVIASSITDGDTTHSPSGDVVFDALALKLSASNNLSDITNALTARNNLKQWDLFLTGGNQTTTSNVASNIIGLVTPTLTANKRYKISGKILVTCSSTGGVKFQAVVPSGSTLSIGFMGNTTSQTTFALYGVAASATLTSTALCTNGSFGSYIDVTGEISTGATAGTIQFGFASGTNTQTSTVYQLGTHLTVTQID